MSRTRSISHVLSAPLKGALFGLQGWPISRLVFVALTTLVAASATAQTVATNFDELRFRVKVGDTVYVTDASRTSEQEARILDLIGSSLIVSIDGVRREFTESNITVIRQRLPDSRKNGALIGFLVGAAGSTAVAIAMASPAGSCTGGCVAGNALIGGGVGALVGLGIDALIQGRKEIYRRGGSVASREIVVRPIVWPRAQGQPTRVGSEIGLRW